MKAGGDWYVPARVPLHDHPVVQGGLIRECAELLVEAVEGLLPVIRGHLRNYPQFVLSGQSSYHLERMSTALIRADLAIKGQSPSFSIVPNDTSRGGWVARGPTYPSMFGGPAEPADKPRKVLTPGHL